MTSHATASVSRPPGALPDYIIMQHIKEDCKHLWLPLCQPVGQDTPILAQMKTAYPPRCNLPCPTWALGLSFQTQSSWMAATFLQRRSWV